MTKKLTSAGFIVAYNDPCYGYNLIYGYGFTAESAMADARYEIHAAEIVIYELEPHDPKGDWMVGSRLHVIPATAALIDAVHEQGPTSEWFILGGIAGTCEQCKPNT